MTFTKKIAHQFITFVTRGNAFDMAVGIIIGAATTSVVNSLVKDIIMPPISMLLFSESMSSLKITLTDSATINLGDFINNCITFIITMFAIFVFIKIINEIRGRKEDTLLEGKKDCPFCKSLINLHATRCPACCANIKPKHKKQKPLSLHHTLNKK
jgi:large conductance mechanosensitive channel